MTSAVVLTLPMRGKILPNEWAWDAASVSAVASSAKTRE